MSVHTKVVLLLLGEVVVIGVGSVLMGVVVVVVVMVMLVLVAVLVLREPALHVVGDEGVLDELAGAVGVEVVGHVVALLLHVVAELVEAGGADHVAAAVDLPGDGGVDGADLVVASGAGSGPGVVGDVWRERPEDWAHVRGGVTGLLSTSRQSDGTRTYLVPCYQLCPQSTRG